MMVTFRTQHLKIPLFGVVESDDQERFRSAFSDRIAPPEDIVVNEATLDVLANDLELDADGLMFDACRYVEGRYRPGSDGLGGGRLGDFGEVVAFLLHRGIQGRKLVRIVSWSAAGMKVKGRKFPQPDFLVDHGGRIGALEVKATEALDYQDLLVRSWKHLCPCYGVDRCREKALPQLGYRGNQRVQQGHQLKPRVGDLVPFPADFGIAVAVVVRDGRLGNLRMDRRFKTLPACQLASPARCCWGCLDSNKTPLHAIAVTMENAPGHLPLRSAGRAGRPWVSAYERWTQSIWAGVPGFASRTANELAQATEKWIREWDLATRDTAPLRTLWSLYLRDAAASRGLPPPDEALSLLLDEGTIRSLHEHPLPQARSGLVQETSFDQLAEAWSQVIAARRQSSFSFVAHDGSTGTADNFTVRVDPEGWSISCLPQEWSASMPLDEDGARRVAKHVLAVRMGLDGWHGHRLDGETVDRLLLPVTVKVGDEELRLGWRLSTWTQVDLPLDTDPHQGHPWPLPMVRGRGVLRSWLAYVLSGGCRSGLVVLPDGRARLRAPWSAETAR